MPDLPVEYLPRRIVSLIPSMTESIFNLGFGHSIVGVTDYCPLPPEFDGRIARVGGPKDAHVTDILGLGPDLVIVNQEENVKETADRLRQAGVSIWETFPKTVRQAIDDLWVLLKMFHTDCDAVNLNMLEKSLEWTEMASMSDTPVRCFCPIWQSEPASKDGWWMTFNGDTYAHDLLRVVGGTNVFANRSWHYDSSDKNARYPRVTLQDIRVAEPEVILLPDEPYHFTEQDHQNLVEWLEGTIAVDHLRIYRVDGRLLFWHGVRLGAALAELPPLLQQS